MAVVVGEIPMLESTDGLKQCDMSDKGDKVSPPTMVVDKDGPDKDIVDSNEEHMRQTDLQDRTGPGLVVTEGPREEPDSYLHLMGAWYLP